MAAAAAEMSEPLLRRLQNLSPLFNWVGPSLGRGISLNAIWTLPSSLLHGVGDVRWADGELRRRAHVPLARALVGAFWRPLAVAAAHKALADLLRYLPPLLLSLLLEDLRQPADEGDVPRMLALALALPLCTLAQAVLVNQYFWRVLQLGVLVRSALAAGVCRRALRYRLCERVDGGRLSNMIASDCARVNTAIGSVCMLWSAPLQLGIALALLWRALGPATLGGLGIMVALVPLQLLISRALTRLRARTAAATDARLRRAEAALRASRAVKLHGWEELCADDVLDARRAELRLMRLESLVKSLNMMLVTIAPTLVSLCTFTALALSGGALHASTVFSSIALFNALRAPLSALPDLFASPRTPASRSRGCRRCSARRRRPTARRKTSTARAAHRTSRRRCPAPTSSARPARFSRGLRRRRRRRHQAPPPARHGAARAPPRTERCPRTRSPCAGPASTRGRARASATRRASPPSRRPPWRRRCGWAA